MQQQHILIKCDFPECGREFRDVQDWAAHYRGHFEKELNEYSFYEAAREGGRRELLDAVAHRPETLVEEGMRIVAKKQWIRSGIVDYVAKDAKGHTCLIDVTVSTNHKGKKDKLIAQREHLQRLGELVFGTGPPLIRLFVVNDRGALEVT